MQGYQDAVCSFVSGSDCGMNGVVQGMHERARLKVFERNRMMYNS